MSILVFNSGSSSLKFSLFDDAAQETLASGGVFWSGDSENASLTFGLADATPVVREVVASSHSIAVGLIVSALNELDVRLARSISVVGHRVVHGGTTLRESVLIGNSVKVEVSAMSELAPLHNPLALQVIESAEQAFADVPQVAVFDNTSFFSDLPPKTYVYPLPYEWYTDFGIRRFGFHGISHQYCAVRAAELLRQDSEDLRLIVCHLGNGCSATAVRGGNAVATTMGFTPLDGLMMGTRPGSIHPGIAMSLLRRRRLSAAQIDYALNHSSGLLGVSGISSDFRTVEQAASAGNERARLAIDMFADRVRSTIGSLAVLMGGMDGLVFTAGIGEKSASLRSMVCDGLQCLGVQLDANRNQGLRLDCDIATTESPCRILLIQTREDQMIAREARRIVAGAGRMQ